MQYIQLDIKQSQQTFPNTRNDLNCLFEFSKTSRVVITESLEDKAYFGTKRLVIRNFSFGPISLLNCAGVSLINL